MTARINARAVALLLLALSSAVPGAAVALLQPLQGGSCRSVEVDASDPWNRSGILIEQGATYIFLVESIDEPWIDDTISATPGRGWTTWHRFVFWPLRFLARFPQRNWYTLIGAIGEEPEHFFFIGDATIHTAGATGELMSFANDKADRYHNNHGRLSLRVCRE